MLNMSAKSRRVNRSTVPSGTLVLSDRLQGSELHLALKSKVKVHVEGGLGCVDARPSASIACIYLTGEEVTGQLSSDTRSRMTALAKSGVQGVILVECGGVEAEMFPNLQEVASVELGLETIPVSSPDHAAKYLTQMVKSACVSPPGSGGAPPAPVDQALWQTVQCLPRTGPVKARQLLDHFHSLRSISEASVEELKEVVGVASATAIHTFFRQPLTEESSAG